MTLKQYLLSHLDNCGMFAEDAQAVFQQFSQEADSASLSARWEDNIEGDHSSLLTTILFRLNATAVAWIDANQPEAWYRAMFVNEVTP